MIRNYIKIALRNLTRSKGYSLINIGGLAVGMTVAMLIGFWIFDELTFDSYNKNYDRVAQIMQHQTFNGHKGTDKSIPIPLRSELQRSYGGDFKYLVLSSWTGDHILTVGTNSFSKSGNYMEPDAPSLMSLDVVTGTTNGLREPNSILLAQSVAKALFGDKDPLNELIRIDNKLDVRVTGVYKDIPYNSDFSNITFIAPWELYVSSEAWVKRALQENQWDNNSFQLFAQLADHADLKTVNAKIKNIKYDHDENERPFKPEMFLHPIKEWHLRSNWDNGVQTGGLIQYVWFFGIVGVFVLLLACINFMNLSTARSEKRAKEVGIRKSIGSARAQLIGQFLSESMLIVIVAFLLAIILVSASLPSFNQLADKKITLPLVNFYFWTITFVFIVSTGLLAGSYPALYLSSFQPVTVLKGTFRSGRLSSLPRKILVVLQFSVSVMLIIGTSIVYRQIQFTKNRPIGYDRNGIIMMQMKSPDFYGKYDLLRNELKNARAVEEMAESSSPLTEVWSNNGGFDWEGKDPILQAEFATIWVTTDFGKTVDWHVKEGRDFSRSFSTDTAAVILNEAAVKFMNMDNPVGRTIKWNGRDYRIVAVVENILMQSPFQEVKQTLYFNNFENVNWIVMKLNPANSAHESIARISAVFKKYLPLVPFDYKFADDEHARKFASEERIGTLSGIFAMLAVFISCLGLLGLASFVAEQRTKEIGIRKVLGASVSNLWQMLSRDFVILVLIACFVAIPVAYYFADEWLKGYTYHTEISWWIFLAAGGGAVVITLLTVSFQAIRAAVANPVHSLRSE